MASPRTKRWCRTKVNVDRFFYSWTIENFLECCEEKITSPKFTCTDDDKLEWCLLLQPKKRVRGEVNVSTELRLISTNVNEVSTMMKVSIIDSEGREVVLVKDSGYYFTHSASFPTCSYDLQKRETLITDSDRLIPNGNLSLHFTGTIYHDLETNSGTGKMPLPISVPESTLSDDFGMLLKSGDGSDLSILVEKKEFKVHKAILKTRSKVFKAMFAHELKESQESKVNICDLKPAIVKEMLHFIYTGQAPNLHEMAEKLLEAADKYMLDRLKKMCEQHLSSNMTHENAANILVLADMHSANELKKSALEYIKKHIRVIIETAGWSALYQDCPHLVKSILLM